MATEMQRAENKYEFVRLFHWVAMQAPESQKETARKEAAYLLVNYLTRTYSAVHDISPVDVIRTEMVELRDDYEVMRKLADLYRQIEEAKDEKERARLVAEVDKVDTDACEVPSTELGKEFARLAQIAYSEASAEDESDLLLSLAPTLQNSRDEFIKNYESKAARLKELDARKSRLLTHQAQTTALAVGLQLMGLFFILSRDVIKDINDKKKAEAAKAS